MCSCVLCDMFRILQMVRICMLICLFCVTDLLWFIVVGLCVFVLFDVFILLFVYFLYFLYLIEFVSYLYCVCILYVYFFLCLMLPLLFFGDACWVLIDVCLNTSNNEGGAMHYY